jgi:hypothetical protein
VVAVRRRKKEFRIHKIIILPDHNTKNSRPCPPQRSKGSSENFCSMPNRKRFT